LLWFWEGDANEKRPDVDRFTEAFTAKGRKGIVKDIVDHLEKFKEPATIKFTVDATDFELGHGSFCMMLLEMLPYTNEQLEAASEACV